MFLAPVAAKPKELQRFGCKLLSNLRNFIVFAPSRAAMLAGQRGRAKKKKKKNEMVAFGTGFGIFYFFCVFCFLATPPMASRPDISAKAGGYET